jgi:outer membrane receptor protein involved in Fe transport
MKRGLQVVAGVVVALALAAPGRVLAQTDTGTIDGRVFDESKAAIPGATITARNTATGLTRTTVSSASGTYRIESLPAGRYDVSIVLQGFSAPLHQGVEVQVGTATTVDFTMKVGAVTETVTVTGETPLVQTTRSDVGQVITSQLVENIPLNGRKFQDLSLLVPGTRQANYYDPTKTEVGGVSYGGLTARSVIINVDGGDNNDGVVRGLLQQFSADAIQEYKVTTQRYSAEFGRSVGGVVNVITKSGTNQLKGSGFLFARDDALNAKTHFEKEENLDKQPFNQQQIGFTVGGPIRQDRAHYFGAYEWNRRNDFATISTGGVLPAEEGPAEKPFRNHLITGKASFTPGEGQTLMVRYAREDQKRLHDFIGGNTLASAGATNTNEIDSVIAKHTSVMGTNRVNEVLVLFQSFENNITAEDNTKPGIRTPDFFFGANVNTPQQTIQRRWQFKDDFSFRQTGWGGDHDFKAGAEVIRSHYGGFFTPTLYGWFNFATAVPGNDINAYLNAIADTFTGSAGDNSFDDNWTYTSIYFQDDYRPTPRLTLNLGLRYEVQVGPYTNRFDTVSLRALSDAGARTERQNDLNNVGPRVGFAYDVRGDARTVVRGGYGIYYDEIFSNITLYEYWSQVDSPTFFVSASPPAFTPAEYAANRDAIRNSFKDPTFAGQLLRLTSPDLQQPYSHHVNLGAAHQFTNSIALDVDYVHAEGKQEVHRWRINTPQNVNTRISPAGVFAPQYGAILVQGNRGRSRFDGLYLTGKVRMPKISVISTYALTYGKNISDGFNTQPADITNADWELDWGWMPNDLRHRFTTGAIFQLPAGVQYSMSLQANTGKPYSASAGLGGLRSAVRAVDAATGQMFPRNSFRADGFFSWDMRVSKMIDVGHQRSLEILFEVFNISDTVNFNRDDYFTRFTSSNFGEPSAIVTNSQRQAAFGGRIRF